MDLKFEFPKEVLQPGTEVWFIYENKVACWYIWAVTFKQWHFRNEDYNKPREEIGTSLQYEIRDSKNGGKTALLPDASKWRTTKEELLKIL